MDELAHQAHPPGHHRPGRPRRGTELARADQLMAAATAVFLREGFGAASIDKVAAEAGVSTRTIYERYKNKADLLGSVINRLIERDLAPSLAALELDRLEPREALTIIGRAVTGRACDPDSAALFRILVTEAQRFPELAEKVKRNKKTHVYDAIAAYFRTQIRRGTMSLADPDRAASLFMQMICAEAHDRLIFGTVESVTALDPHAHVEHAIDIFLNGALLRARPTPGVS